MPRPKSPPRVKFYEESMPDGRTRYRVRLIKDGILEDTTFWNKREATSFQTKLEAELLKWVGRTVGEALDAWYVEKSELGIARPNTCVNQKPRIRRVLADDLDANLASITPDRAQAIYRSLVEAPTAKSGRPLAPASHRYYLKICRAFFAWCVSKGYLAKNPFAEVRPVGRVSRGKPQLRSEEVSRYIAAGLHAFTQRDDRLALAAVMLPIFGLRAGEALSRRVRDIDRGRVWRLHIDPGLDDQRGQGELLKNENARRVLEIPPVLIPHLERLIEGRGPNEYLFGSSRRTGKRKGNQMLWRAVTRTCQQAGVPRVCPHSMRGYYASAGVRSGALPHVVAANMGHSSFTVTAQHYAEPQAVAEAHSARVMQLLDLEHGAAALSHLPAEQLLDKLPASTLARIAQLIAERSATAPTAPTDGSSLPTGIRTESIPAVSNPAVSRQKN